MSMLKQLLNPIYQLSHDLLNDYNPLWKKRHADQSILRGHISEEHLQNPRLDEALFDSLAKLGVKTASYRINIDAYRQYLTKVNYPKDYYGGGHDPEANFTEKTLEHFVSTDFMHFHPETVFVDVAACSSPFYQIIQGHYGVQKAYQQDLIYPKGIHGEKIGGYASELCLPDQSVDIISLHCSLEHFEDDSDTAFFQELARVLKVGGRAIVLPFYLAHTYTIHVDPAYNLLKFHHPTIDPLAQLRYCNWYQFFSRHYDPEALQRRILEKAPSLSLTVYKVENFREVDESCYLRWIGVFEKK